MNTVLGIVALVFAVIAWWGVATLDGKLRDLLPLRDRYAQERIDRLRDDLNATIIRLERLAEGLTDEPATLINYVDLIAHEGEEANS